MSVVAAPAARESEARYARLALAALLAGAGTVAVVVTYTVSWDSTTLVDPHPTAIIRTLLVAAWIAAGLLMAWRRAEPGLAALVAAAGFLFTLVSLNAMSGAAAFTVGRVALSFVSVYVAFIALRVAEERLGSAVSRWFVPGLTVALVVLWVLTLPIAEKLPPSGQFSYCGDTCPPNAFNVVTWPGPARVLGGLITVATATGLIGLVILLVVGVRSAPARRRYAYLPLIYALMLWSLSYVLFTTTRGVSWEGYDQLLRFVGAVGAIGTPFALLAAERRSRAFAAERVHTLVTAGSDTSPERVSELVRDGLGDPHATLAVLDDERACFVDAAGHAVDIESSGKGRILVSRGGRVVAALLYDTAATDEGAARALAGAALTLLDNGRLVAELRASRIRSATAAAAERSRLERDLHDGAQQSLLALRLRLGDLEADADPVTAAQLAAIDADLATALEELRAIAHGIYPAVLRERGVGDALRALALRSPVSIRVATDGVGRFDGSAELAVYFCALEAVQNATRHGGPGTVITITLAAERDDIVFAIEDDGPGFELDSANGGIGLTSMRDRIGAVGGHLEITSESGAGTTVRGGVPASATP